ncbi:hypothetical protein LTR50_004724 [Elasticomyces elasticus]|nr:hypothetical protein LTR50_004724 [Elasticomyces elasticus]
MCGVLARVNNKPQSEWRNSRITLNGVIALLATITKAALMVPVAEAISQRKWLWFLSKGQQGGQKGRDLQDFEAFDNASRGAWGSAVLLLKPRFWHVVSIGAAITVLSLIFSTLTQNVLATETRTVEGAPLNFTTSDIKRSDTYHGWQEDPSYVGEVSTEANIPTKAAIYNGIFSNVTDLPVTCPTGNCTWPIIPSVGVCGACMDMKSHLVRECNSTICSYSIPRGSTLYTSANPDRSSDLYRPYSIFTAGSGTNAKLNNTAAVGGSSPRSWIGSYNFIGLPRNAFLQRVTDRKMSEPLQISDLIAAECGMWYCLQAHYVNVSFGNIVQSHTDHWNEAQEPDLMSGDDVFNLTGKDIINFTNVPAAFNLDPGTVYGVDVRAFIVIGIALDGLLQGDVLNAGQAVGSGNSDCVRAVWYFADNLDAWISNLALSVSNHIRLTDTAQVSKRYAGTAWAPVVYVKVRWAYLTFPIAMVVLSIAFWASSVVETLRSPAKPWKSSALAVLYARLDQELQNEAANGLLEEDDLGKYVHRRKVVLSDQEDGWVFRSPLR